MDHHYVFPASGGDLLAAEIEAARRIGLRFCATRGSMNLGRSSGGLPPDEVVEDADRILSECEAAVAAYHDSSFCSSAGAPWSTGASCARPTWRSSLLPTGRAPARSRSARA
jgi:hypothetical protein